MTNQPEFANFNYEIYFAGMGGQVPDLPLAYRDLEAHARETLDDRAYGYVAGGAGSEDTVAENDRAFQRWRIVPRMMRDVSTRDLSVELFGTTLPAPMLLAPIGVQSIIHPDAEVATARGAASVNVPSVLSTAASKSLEEVAEAAGDTPRWYQLYWPSDPDVARSLVQRAEAAGYSAIVVTLDTKIMAWRPRDLDTAYLPFLHGEGLANYFTDEAFMAALDQSPEDDPQTAILRWAGIFSDRTHTWTDLATLREHTDLPILVKGVLHPQDASIAVEFGADGIIVSNHGGRQVDGAVGALDALPSVVAAVDDEVPVLFDSGIRTGADIVKAIALGARAVLLGRPFAWGLALDGEAGVRHVVRSILAELDLTMALSGFTTLDDLTPDVLVRSP